MATTAAPSLTIEEFSKLPRENQRHELNEGKLVKMPPPKLHHTLLAQTIQEIIRSFLKQVGGARALMEAGYVLSRDPLTIRQPDVSVVTHSRILATPVDDYCEGAPELAIEVVSPTDPAEDLEEKAWQYLQAGAKEIWIVYPKTKSVHVYYAGGGVKVFAFADTLESAALPQFSVKVSALFPQ